MLNCNSKRTAVYRPSIDDVCTLAVTNQQSILVLGY